MYILAYRIHPSGKYLTLAIKPNVNHEKDGQGQYFRKCVYKCLELYDSDIYEIPTAQTSDNN